MKLTKYTHACVRLEHDGGVLVIDPGIWSEPDALIGADAILVTHEHTDHVDRLRLAGLGAPVYAPASAAIPDLDFTEVGAGQELTLAGFRVRAVGGRHATAYDGRPDCANLGYIVNDAVYHPGDSLFVPDQPVDTLLLPAQAPWLKLAEAIEFVRTVHPRRAIAIHDGLLNERGITGFGFWITSTGGTDYRWLAPGQTA